jgi:hypothetical protein
MLGFSIGLASARMVGGGSVPLSIVVDGTRLRLLSRKESKPPVVVPLEEVRSIEEREKGAA